MDLYSLGGGGEEAELTHRSSDSQVDSKDLIAGGQNRISDPIAPSGYKLPYLCYHDDQVVSPWPSQDVHSRIYTQRDGHEGRQGEDGADGPDDTLPGLGVDDGIILARIGHSRLTLRPDLSLEGPVPLLCWC